MIEGLKVTITGAELKTLCETRAQHHDDRASFYQQQKKALPDIDQDVVPQFTNASKKPQEMMQDRIDSHRAEAAELRFIAVHLTASESYLLDRPDLVKIGIVQRGY